MAADPLEYRRAEGEVVGDRMDRGPSRSPRLMLICTAAIVLAILAAGGGVVGYMHYRDTHGPAQARAADARHKLAAAESSGPAGIRDWMEKGENLQADNDVEYIVKCYRDSEAARIEEERSRGLSPKPLTDADIQAYRAKWSSTENRIAAEVAAGKSGATTSGR